MNKSKKLCLLSIILMIPIPLLLRHLILITPSIYEAPFGTLLCLSIINAFDLINKAHHISPKDKLPKYIENFYLIIFVLIGIYGIISLFK